MNIKCILGFHDWDFYQCKNCGKIRDFEHNTKINCEKCEKCGKEFTNFHNWKEDCQNCSKCGTKRNIEHDWEGKKCKKCTKTRELSSNEDMVTTDSKKTNIKLKTIDFVYKWILIKDVKNTNLKNSVSDFVGKNILGYVYIDNQAGITLDVYYFFDYINHKIQITDSLIDKKIRLMLRYGSFKDLEVDILSENLVTDLKLIVPEWLKSYRFESDDLMVTRNNRDIDVFRHEEYLDDVQVLLFGKGLQPEIVWCRLEKELQGNYFQSRLLNKPNQDFKISVGELVEIFHGTIVTNSGKKEYIMCKTSMDRLKS